MVCTAFELAEILKIKEPEPLIQARADARIFGIRINFNPTRTSLEKGKVV
jgi:hypothetical protein